MLVTVHYRQNNETAVSKTEQNRLVLTELYKENISFLSVQATAQMFCRTFFFLRPRYKPSETKQTLHWSRRWQHSIELHKQCLNMWIVVKHSNFFPRILQKLEHFRLVFGSGTIAVLLTDVLVSVLSMNP
jgi:hypothetical protein